MTLDLDSRSEFADRLRSRKASVARTATTEFLTRHPEIVARCGSRADECGIEDASYHFDFLVAAVQAGSPALLCDYLRWSLRTLSARGIGVDVLLDKVQQVMQCALAGEAPAAVQLLQRIHRESLTLLAKPELHEPSVDYPELSAVRAPFFDAVLRGERQTALQFALEALDQGADTAALYVGLFERCMYEIGKRWERQEVTVAQEHMATATVQYVVAQLYGHLQIQAPTHGKVLITGVEGEHHQLGANLVADVLEANGFDVRFLGTNVPESAVLSAVEQECPSLIGISTTMAFNLPKAISLVRFLQGSPAAGKHMPIMLGGAAFAHAPRLASELGALGIGLDVGEALLLARSTHTQSHAHGGRI